MSSAGRENKSIKNPNCPVCSRGAKRIADRLFRCDYCEIEFFSLGAIKITTATLWKFLKLTSEVYRGT